MRLKKLYITSPALKPFISLLLLIFCFLPPSPALAEPQPEIFKHMGHAGMVWSVAFSPDGKFIASGCLDNTVKVWDSSTGELLCTLIGHESYVSSVHFSPDGKFIASGSGDKTVKVWDTSTGSLFRTLSRHDNFVSSVHFSPDGKFIASGSFDKTVKVWDISTGALLRTLIGHYSAVSSVHFSPDGKFIASGSRDKTVRVWDISTGALLYTLSGHDNFVNSVHFSPDGKFIASGSGDMTVKVWDSSTGAFLCTFSGHEAGVNSVHFSPDGKFIASGSGDKTVKVWDSSTGALLCTLSGHEAGVNSAHFSPYGQSIVSGSEDRTIRLWNVSDGSQELIMALLHGNEWSAYHPVKKLYYMSLDADRYMSVRFDNQTTPVYPLTYYSDQMIRGGNIKILSLNEAAFKPKRLRLWWDTTPNIGWKLSVVLFSVNVIFLWIIILLRKRSNPLEVSKRFFPKAGFNRIEVLHDILLLYAKGSRAAGLAWVWDAEKKETLSGFVGKQSEKLEDKPKVYLVYKRDKPDNPFMQSLREKRYEVIPVLSSKLEKATYDRKYIETLKEIEEPFLTRSDPYFELKPVHDPTWFYGRDVIMQRLPAVLAHGQHVGIFGLRRVGKTSLIKQIQNRFSDMPVAYLDCQAVSPAADAYFNTVLNQLYSELSVRKIARIRKPKPVSGPDEFSMQFMAMVEAWKKKGRLEPFLIIMDEIDKFFPNRRENQSEAILGEYVRFFRLLRGIAQTHQCLTSLVVAYRPSVNRHNLLTPSVGENPMFNSFQEEHLGFLTHDETVAMIREIGSWKDIQWEEEAAKQVFYYCGGHPLVSRYFASIACEGGTLKQVDMKQAQKTAAHIQKTFRTNDIGNYYQEGVWNLLTEHEKQVLSLICKADSELSEANIPEKLEEALAGLEHFGLVVNKEGIVCLTANLFYTWLKRKGDFS